MASEHEPYRPNAELARYHLVTALETLLTRDPVHGTSFLVTLHETVSSPAFPTDVNRARSVLAHGPLRSARPTLLRNATVVFTKQVLSSDSREDASPFAVALGALHSFRRHDVEEILRAELPRLVNEADERHLELVLELCYFLDEAWPLLPIPSRAMVEELVRTTSDSTVVLRAAGATHLRVLACSRAADVSVAGFKQLQGIEALREGIVDLIVASYCRSANFSHGNAVFNVILGEVVPQLSPGHVDQIIDAVFSNSQVRGLTTLTRLLRSIARTGGGRFKPNLLAAHQRLLSLDHFDSGHLELAEVVASEFKEDIDKTLSRDEFMSIVITPVGDIEDSEFPPEEELPF